MSVTIGVDIAKLKFDVCILKSEGSKSHAAFDNNKSGFKKLCRLLKNETEKYFALEATGIYGGLCSGGYRLRREGRIR